MKLWIVLLLIAVVACTAPAEEIPRAQPVENDMDTMIEGTPVPIDPAKSSFEFEGYGPGKSHVGTFSEMAGTIVLADRKVVATEGTIQAASVKSDSGGLDKHLKNEDFFDVENYPVISFESSSISEETMNGQLTFHGVTKELSIPVTHGDGSLSAEFVISMEQFGISYSGVNDEVRIAFEIAP